MATRRSSLASRYKSLQRSYSGFSSSLSSYAKTIQKRNQSAEDKIIDDNYSNGLITTDAYIEYLNDRSTRAYLTPLQRTNLQIKIRDTQEKYQDEQVQTAYQNGGFINGQKVDDSYLLGWEKNKLEKMAPGSTAYEQQNQKVMGLTDKIQKAQRRDFRLQSELEIARTPDYDFSVLRKKQQMYEELQAQAEADGDLEQAQQFALSATNYKNSADKAEIGFGVRQNVNARQDQRFEDQQNINAMSNGSVPVAQNGVPQPAVPGQAPMGPSQGPSMDQVEQPQEQPDFLDQLEAINWSDLREYYNEDDAKKLEGLNKTIENKKKTIARLESDKEYYDGLVDEYMAAAEASTDPDEQLKYWNQVSDAAEKSLTASTRIQEEERAIDETATNSAEKLDDLNKSVAGRILSDVDRGVLMEKAKLDAELQQGRISKEDFIKEEASYYAVLQNISGIKEHIYQDVYFDDEKLDKVRTEKVKYEDELTKSADKQNNPWAYEPVVSKDDGLVTMKNVSDSKLNVDEKNTPFFDKKYQKYGNVYVEVDYKNRKGEQLTDDQIKSMSKEELEKNRKYGVVYRALEPGGPRVRTVTDFTKDGGVQKIQAYDTNGNLTPVFERPKEQTLLQKTGNALLGAAAWVQTKVAQPAADFIAKGFENDRKYKDQFIRSVVGEPVKKIGAELRSAVTPRVAYAETFDSAGPKLQGVPEEYQDKIIATAQKYGVGADKIAALLEQESRFDPSADNGQDRGIAQINRSANPDVSDEQAFDPNFAIDFVGKRLSELVDQTGSEYDAVRAYNGGLSGYKSSTVGWDGKRTVDQITRGYADGIFEKAKKYSIAPKPEGNVLADSRGLRSQNTLLTNNKPTLRSATNTPTTKLAPDSYKMYEDTKSPKLVQAKTPAPLKSKVKDTAKEIVKQTKAVAEIATNKNSQKAFQKGVQDTLISKGVAKPGSNSYKALETAAKVQTKVQNAVNTAKTTVKNVADTVKKKASSVVSGIRSFFGK